MQIQEFDRGMFMKVQENREGSTMPQVEVRTAEQNVKGRTTTLYSDK